GRWTGGFFRGVLRAPLVSMFVGQRLHGLSVKEDQQTLLALSKLIEAGGVNPGIDRTFPLIEAADAIRYLEQGHPAGKVVVTVTASPGSGHRQGNPDVGPVQDRGVL